METDLINSGLLDSEFESNFLGIFKSKKKKEQQKKEYDDYLAERKRKSGIDLDYMERKEVKLPSGKRDEIAMKKRDNKKPFDFDSIFGSYKTEEQARKDENKETDYKAKEDKPEEDKRDTMPRVGDKEAKFLGMKKETGIIVASVGGALVLGAIIFTIIKVSKR